MDGSNDSRNRLVKPISGIPGSDNSRNGGSTGSGIFNCLIYAQIIGPALIAVIYSRTRRTRLLNLDCDEQAVAKSPPLPSSVPGLGQSRGCQCGTLQGYEEFEKLGGNTSPGTPSEGLF